MRVPLSWLADYVDHGLTTDDLASRMTMTGLKIEAVERVGSAWSDIVVGQVIEISPHPTSNKPLHVARVDLGHAATTVVTGAQNVRLGDKAPLVPLGGFVPFGPDGKPLRIEPRSMAGIASEGMLASARELGISEEHDGILILAPDAPVGATLRSVLGDDVLDIETNPNRPDTLSVIGIAREVAAFTKQQLTLPDLGALPSSVEWVDRDSVAIEIQDADLCPRYSALRIDGVEVIPSPPWLSTRLQHAGMRSINLLVDLTNYVMLEYGQPMHAFDARQLTGERIVVRRARASELLTTLDGVARQLTSDDLVIVDGARAIAVAGVMGGENSEISPDTTSIVLESATFNAVSVRRTAQSLGLRTEASSRFEKDLPSELTLPALRRFLQLLAQILDRPLRAYRISDVLASPPEARSVTMPIRDLDRLIGLPISAERASEELSLLGFSVEQSAMGITVHVPFWRRADIELSADLVEEVARMVGYEHVPSTLPPRTMAAPPLPPPLALEGAIQESLPALGLSEVVTHSLTSATAMARLASPDLAVAGVGPDLWAQLVPNPAGVYAREARVEPIELANYATQDRRLLRLLLLPSVLEVAARNLKHTTERLAFFELGRTMFKHPGNVDLPYERRTLALVLTGKRRPPSWLQPEPAPFTFFDVKGVLTTLFDRLRVPNWKVSASPHPALHPGRSAVVEIAGQQIAFFGELHPEVAAQFDLSDWPVQVVEMDLDALLPAVRDARVFRPLPRFPAVFRDIALVVGSQVTGERLLHLVRSLGGELLESADIFDVYVGDPLPSGSRSIAIGLTFRAPGATLTQEEVGPIVDRIVATLATELGASLRE